MAICESGKHCISSFGEEANFIGYLVKESPFDWVNVSPRFVLLRCIDVDIFLLSFTATCHMELITHI